MAFLIDFHTHFFSRSFFLALARASAFSNEPEAAVRRVATSAGLELPAEDDLEHLQRWFEQMDRHGVSHMASFASVPEELPVLARVAEASEGRIIPFGITDPTQEGCADTVERMLSDQGFRGVVLFPAMHGYTIDGPEAAPLLHVLARHRAVAVVHCGMLKVPLRDRFGLPRNYDLTKANPLHLVPAADEHHAVRFVIPHFGAGFFRETLMAGAQCENVFVDTSSSNSWRASQPRPMEMADVFERTFGVFGPRRVLFGTDSCVFPRGWRHEIFLSQREAMGACGLDAEAKAQVLGENAAHLLRIRSQSDAVRSPV